MFTMKFILEKQLFEKNLEINLWTQILLCLLSNLGHCGVCVAEYTFYTPKGSQLLLEAENWKLKNDTVT